MTVFIASLIYVGLKAFQQLNVIHHRLLWVIPVSYGLAVCEVVLIGTIAVHAVNAAGVMAQAVLIVQIGTGAGLGAVASMVLHRRMRHGG